MTVTIVQRPQVVNVQAQVPVASFLPFSFVADSDGQAAFESLPATPLSVVLLAINGTAQRNGTDFTISGLVITLAAGVAANISTGDAVYGMIQI